MYIYNDTMTMTFTFERLQCLEDKGSRSLLLEFLHDTVIPTPSDPRGEACNRVFYHTPHLLKLAVLTQIGTYLGHCCAESGLTEAVGCERLGWDIRRDL